MTTVAFDGRTLACDSMLTSNNTITGHEPKMVHVKGYGAVAMAGSINCLIPVAKEIFNGTFDQTKIALSNAEEGDNSFYALYLNKDGICVEWANGVHPRQQNSPYAIGSGSPFALSVMNCFGIKSKTAVETAIKMDCYSGGQVTAYNPDADATQGKYVITFDNIEELNEHL